MPFEIVLSKITKNIKIINIKIFKYDLNIKNLEQAHIPFSKNEEEKALPQNP